MKVLTLVVSGILLSSTVFATEVSINHQDLVERELIAVYSQGWEDADEFSMSKDDIWGMEYTESVSDACKSTVTGYARKPDYSGPVDVQFWVCLIEDHSGQWTAEFIEDEYAGD